MGGVLVGTIIWVIAIVVSLYYINKYVGQQSNHATPHVKAANQKIAIFTVIMAGISMWMMWTCCYMHQMYPLISPKMESAGHQ